MMPVSDTQKSQKTLKEKIIGYKRHIFYQSECDYPDCGKLLHVESGGQSIEWFHDIDRFGGASPVF